MKIKNIIFNVLMAVIAISVSSCDPDVEIPGQENVGRYTMVYMPQAEGGPRNYTLAIRETPSEIVVGAACGGFKVPDDAIQVDIVIDPALVDEYNTSKGTTYTALPAESFTVTGSNVTIERGGSTSSAIRISIRTQEITPFKEYMIAAKIQSVSDGIPVNEKLQVAYFIVKTQPDLADYPQYSRTLWSVNSFSTEEPAEANWGNGGQVLHTFDGMNNTFWHTKWNGGEATPPHWFVIDMGKTNTLHGLQLLTRQSDNSGKPKDVTVELSEDGDLWVNGGTFTMQNVSTLQTQFLTEGFNTNARYFKVTVTSSYGAQYTHLAEIYAF